MTPIKFNLELKFLKIAANKIKAWEAKPIKIIGCIKFLISCSVFVKISYSAKYQFMELG
mgnify:CR=1 FL=1